MLPRNLSRWSFFPQVNFFFPKLSLVIVNRKKPKKPTKHNSWSCPSDNAWWPSLSTHLCPKESHFKRHLCRGSFSPAEKPCSHPRAFPEVMRGGEWDQSSGMPVTAQAGFLPAPLGQSQPSAATKRQKKKKSERFAKTHSLYLLPKRTKENCLPEVTLNSGDISVTSPRMINSWIVGWLVYCVHKEWKIANISRHLPHARPTVVPSKSCEVGFIIPILWTHTVARRPSK